MPKKTTSRSAAGLGNKSWAMVAPALVVLAAACQERDRLTFPDPGDDIGPVTIIDQPSHSDTTVPAGPGFYVYGRMVDADGVDSVYFLVTNGDFLPYRPESHADTVPFGLPVSTFGYSGDTIAVDIYGVDRAGNRGEPTSRRIIVE